MGKRQWFCLFSGRLRRFMETLWDNSNFVSTVIANLPPRHLITTCKIRVSTTFIDFFNRSAYALNRTIQRERSKLLSVHFVCKHLAIIIFIIRVSRRLRPILFRHPGPNGVGVGDNKARPRIASRGFLRRERESER